MKGNYTCELKNTMDWMNTKGAFLTSGDKHKANTMTISWGSIGYMWKKPIFIIIVSNTRYTKKFIDYTNTFTVSVTYDKKMEEALQICGHSSGINTDKEAQANIRFIQSKIVDSPIVEDCNKYYECKVVLKQDIDLEKIDNETIYKNGESEHTMYFGEIVAQYSVKTP